MELGERARNRLEVTVKIVHDDYCPHPGGLAFAANNHGQIVGDPTITVNLSRHCLRAADCNNIDKIKVFGDDLRNTLLHELLHVIQLVIDGLTGEVDVNDTIRRAGEYLAENPDYFGPMEETLSGVCDQRDRFRALFLNANAMKRYYKEVIMNERKTSQAAKAATK